MSRILVAGAGGFIGGHLTKSLIEQGHSVVAVDCNDKEDWYQFHTESDNRFLDLRLRDQCDSAVKGVSGVKLKRKYNLAAPQGVRGRNSDNTLVRSVLNWEPTTRLVSGIEETYKWIYGQLSK